MCECPACVAKAEGGNVTGYCVRVFECQCMECANWRASNFCDRHQPCAKTPAIIEGKDGEEFVLHAELSAPAEEWLEIPAFLRRQQTSVAGDVKRFRDYLRMGGSEGEGLDIEDAFQNGSTADSGYLVPMNWNEPRTVDTSPPEIALSLNCLDECGDQVEVLRVSIEGVHYMGELVKDAGEAYRAVVAAMRIVAKQTGGSL